MNPEEFTSGDMIGAWVFLIVAGGAGLLIGRLFEHYRTKK